MDAQRTSIVVGIGGGTGGGKTTFARSLVDALPSGAAVILDHDAYYRDLSHLPPADRARTNFDHPDSLESELCAQHLIELRAGRAIHKPIYDFRTHTRTATTEVVEAAPVIVVEGILALAVAALREHFDLRLFVDAPADLRLLRRIRRDIHDRGRDIDSIARQYEGSVRPMHEAFVEPSRACADMVISGLGDFGNALRTTADALRHRLRLES